MPVNPVDVTTDWSRFAQMYGETLKALMASDEVDAVVPVLLQRSALMPEVTARIVAEQEIARAARNPKADPRLLGWTGRRRGKQTAIALGRHSVSSVDGLRTARVVAKSRVPPVHATPPVGPPLPIPATADAEGWLDPETTFRLLAEAGVSFATWQITDGANAVAAAAAMLAFLAFSRPSDLRSCTRARPAP